MRLSTRKLLDHGLRWAALGCALAAASVLIFVLGSLLFKGGASLNLNTFTQLPVAPGESGGGMKNAVLGSLQLVGLAVLIGLPLGLLAGIYLAEYGQGRWAACVRASADLLNGMPSITLGIFAYTLLVRPIGHFSWLAGSVALSLILIPGVVRSTEDFLRLTPIALREAASALGAPKWRVIASVLLPAASRGLLTGILIAVARIFGETAPLLFTSFSNRFVAQSIADPVASLPGMIYVYAISPYADWQQQAWAASLLLVMIVLLLNLLARRLTR